MRMNYEQLSVSMLFFSISSLTLKKNTTDVTKTARFVTLPNRFDGGSIPVATLLSLYAALGQLVSDPRPQAFSCCLKRLDSLDRGLLTPVYYQLSAVAYKTQWGRRIGLFLRLLMP